MKRAQAGSAGPVIVLLVVAVLVWWKWDRVASLFGGAKGGAGGAAVVEVLDYRCDRHTDGRVRLKGSVRNITDGALGLWAVSSIGYQGSGAKAQITETRVKPDPVAPGAVGTFETDGPAFPEPGFCKLNHFLDAATSKSLGYRGPDLANFAKPG